MGFWKTAQWLADTISGDTSTIHSVAEEAEKTPFTLATRSDLQWKRLDQSCVETQTFYCLADSGHVVMFQVIYSHVQQPLVNFITCQVSTKIFYPQRSDGTRPDPFWRSQPLNGYQFSHDNTAFTCDPGCSVTLNQDGTAFKVYTDIYQDGTVCDFEISRGSAPGFKVGQDGTSYYGRDLDSPDGIMRHVFWPRCKISGSITTKSDGKIDLNGCAVFIHALQGMLPNYIASRWNFITCHTSTYSAIQMEFTTPEYYQNKTVTVGGVVTDDSVVLAGAQVPIVHTDSHVDPVTNWPTPTALRCKWSGKGETGECASAGIDVKLGPWLSRIDVFHELPSIAKQLISTLLNTKPYVYQYCCCSPLTISTGVTGKDTTIEEEAKVFFEASFIS